MTDSTLTRLFRFLTREPRLLCDKNTWDAGTKELHRRTDEKREAGAFLLGNETLGSRRIKKFLFYDDIDPNCFDHGIVEFNGHKFGKVWEVCKSLDMDIVADVHVHPGGYGQSPSDQENPMKLEAGHLALILPDYAKGDQNPGDFGIYEYLGQRRWTNHTRLGQKFFRIR